VARALLRVSGVPIAAPSANCFGHSSPTTAQHVLDGQAKKVKRLNPYHFDQSGTPPST